MFLAGENFYSLFASRMVQTETILFKGVSAEYHATKCQIGDLSRVILIFMTVWFHTINFKLHPMLQLMRNHTIYEELHNFHQINQSTLDVWSLWRRVTFGKLQTLSRVAYWYSASKSFKLSHQSKQKNLKIGLRFAIYIIFNIIYIESKKSCFLVLNL